MSETMETVADSQDSQEQSRGKRKTFHRDQSGNTIRKQMFIALAKRPLMQSEFPKALGMSSLSGQVGVILRSEVFVGRFAVEVHDVNNRDVKLYKLTAKGRKHLANDMVDSYAASNKLNEFGRDKEYKQSVLDAEY